MASIEPAVALMRRIADRRLQASTAAGLWSFTLYEIQGCQCSGWVRGGPAPARLARAAPRRNVDSDSGTSRPFRPRRVPSALATSGGTSSAHSAIAAIKSAPAITAATAKARITAA
jgi:hypothetical protein